MLAQAFKSAAELGITDPQRDALCKTLVLLETGKLVHIPSFRLGIGRGLDFSGHFNMAVWNKPSDCGTVCCIGGTAELVGNVEFAPGGCLKRGSLPRALGDLFYPHLINMGMEDITPAQAATALRSYLTCGDAKWHEAIGAGAGQ